MKHLKILIISFLLIISLFTISASAKEYEISDYEIDLVLEEKTGDYLITERLTFDFQGDTFSWVSRNVKGKGFDKLKLQSIEGINVDITDYEVDQGNKLDIKWYFPDTIGKTAFKIKYRASGGLITRDNKNVIAWMAVGREWDVPIHNLDVQLKLPEVDKIISATPSEYITEKSSNIISFERKKLSPGEPFRIDLSFPVITKTDKETSKLDEDNSIYGFAILIGLGLAFTAAGFDIYNRKKEKIIESSQKYTDLSLPEQALIYKDGNQNNKGTSSKIFKLAKEGKIKLISKVKKGFLGSKSTEIKVEVINEENLNKEEKFIIEKLKEHKNLKKFAGDYKLFNKVHKIAKEHLLELGLFSKEALLRRKKIYFSSLYFIPTGIAALIFSATKEQHLIVGLGVFLFMFGIGRLIKGGVTPILSGEGFYIKEKIEKNLDNKKDSIDKLIKAKKSNKALEYFFNHLENIILHNKFNNSTLNKYKKVFKQADKIEIPDWIEFDLSNLNETLDALDIVEVIDYMMVSMVVIVSNTGASAAGGAAGAGGGAAGGGGGAAG
ncbi:MAG: DUF2207 domain-containing protein [Halothermotrichaceae bacterium]